MVMPSNLSRQLPVWLYFVLAYGISWSIWFIGYASGKSKSLEDFGVFLFLGSFGPLLSALLLTFLQGGMPEVKLFLLRTVQVRVRFWVYLAVFFIFPAVVSFGFLALGFPFKSDPLLNIASLILAMPINGLLTAFLSPGSLGEEPGWRGFALPRLIKLGEWQSVVVLGLLWAFWHLPVALLFPGWRELFTGQTIDLGSWLIFYPVSILALTIMLFKIWKWSGQSFFVCILFHGVVNSTFQITDKISTPYSTTMSFAILVLLMLIAALIFWALDHLVFDKIQAQALDARATANTRS
jgi:uncharacterized protein